MANAKVLRKAQLLRLMVDELCDNIEAREASESCLHTYGSLGYGLEDGQGKTQIQNDIRLCDPVTHEALQTDVPHDMRGGTYAMGGTTGLWLNVTYNYGRHYYRVLGDEGIRTIYGMTGAESIPVLEAAAAKLSDEVSDDYWEATEGNAKRPLLQLAAMARIRPDGVWDGD